MEIKSSDKIKVYEWFYSQLEQLIKETNLALNPPEGSTVIVGNFKIETN
jgi:hypothetical protein